MRERERERQRERGRDLEAPALLRAGRVSPRIARVSTEVHEGLGVGRERRSACWGRRAWGGA